jgi:hypothetical protein
MDTGERLVCISEKKKTADHLVSIPNPPPGISKWIGKHSKIGGLAQPFAGLINFRGAPSLSRFVRQGGGFDFLCQ